MLSRKFQVLSVAAILSVSVAATAPAQTVVDLTQTGCQFLEPEGADLGFSPKKADDCKVINKETGSDRIAKSDVMKLKAGKYVFRVSNKNVPYELGFWIRDADYDWRNPLHKITKTSVSGGGLHQGVTGEYSVELKPGEYVYSCPLNPTPDYKIVVE